MELRPDLDYAESQGLANRHFRDLPDVARGSAELDFIASGLNHITLLVHAPVMETLNGNLEFDVHSGSLGNRDALKRDE
jgi:hypothetical protein